MSKSQDDPNEIKKILRRTVQTNAFVTFPLMIGLAACADHLIPLLLTDKWLPSIPYLRVLCAEYALFLFNTSNQNSYQAIGRSDIYLRNDLITKVISVFFLLATMWISVYAMVIGSLVATIINSYVYAYSNKAFNYGFNEQIKDLFSNVLLTFIMGMIVWGIGYIGNDHLSTLVIQLVVGILVYVAGSRIIRLESFAYFLSIMKMYIPFRNLKK